MNLETIQKLCCPFDKEDLSLQIISQGTTKNILEGVLTCGTCQRYYPIISGIPIMAPDEYRENQLEAPLVEKWKPELLQNSKTDFKLLGNPE